MSIKMIQTTCPFCHTNDEIPVKQEAFEAWSNGGLIQDTCPELSADQREQLITGICGPCWDRSFGE